MATEEAFQTAVNKSKTLTKMPSNENLLALYGLYKQATEGDVTGSRPGMFDLKGRAKFDAWTSQKGKTRETARAEYVALVDKLAKG